MKYFKKFAAELLGTFSFVALSFGLLTLMNLYERQNPNSMINFGSIILVALFMGLVLCGLTYAFGLFSKAAFNPIVSIGYLIASLFHKKEERDYDFKDFFLALLAQIIGTILALMALWGAFGPTNIMTSFRFDLSFFDQSANVTLIIFTSLFILSTIFIFVYLILFSHKRFRKIRGLIYGLSFAFTNLVAMILTGGTLLLLYYLFAGFLELILYGNSEFLINSWVYILPTICGALLASLLYYFFVLVKKEEKAVETAPCKEVIVEEIIIKKEKIVTLPAPLKAKKKTPKKEKTPYEDIPYEKRVKLLDAGMHKKYNQIRNELLAYGLHERISKEHATYKLNNILYCILTIRGNNLKLHLNLNLKDYKDSPIPLKDDGKKDKYSVVPALFKVRSDLSARRALGLINDTMAKAKIEKK